MPTAGVMATKPAPAPEAMPSTAGLPLASHSANIQVSAAIVAFIIYTLTLGKIREIAVLKLIGTKNRTIASMILQQAVALGLIGFVVGKVSATFWAPIFPKYVLLESGDAIRGFFAVVVICVLASFLAIRAALKVDPAEALGG